MSGDTNSYRIAQFQQWLFQVAGISEPQSETYAKRIIESGVVGAYLFSIPLIYCDIHILGEHDSVGEDSSQRQ